MFVSLPNQLCAAVASDDCWQSNRQDVDPLNYCN